MINLITNLLDYQAVGVEKLIKIKVGALFMEQGTGKTRTALELISRRLNDNKIEKVLWLCPCSVKDNLKKDIIKHCAEFPPEITICGIQSLSSSITDNLNCLQLVSNHKCYLVVDESLLIKNPNALRSKNIIRLSKMCKYKLILNGTPISRTEADLFSQFYILDWRILGYKSYWSFSANHLELDKITGRIVRCLNIDYLIKKIEPYSFEVRKQDCLNLPNKYYHEIRYNLSVIQKCEYERVADELLMKLNEFKPETIYRLFSGLQMVISGMYVDTNNNLKTSRIFDIIDNNPRINVLDSIIKQIDNKTIIFCKYSHEITDIVTHLNNNYENDIAVRFDGFINQRKRNINISSFKDNARFLVANKNCAGFGLNLQFCNNIIFYSNDWDFATRSQAEDRIYRLGQTKNCHIYDIVANNTLDNKIINCLINKENLLDTFKNVLKKENIKNWLKGCD